MFISKTTAYRLQWPPGGRYVQNPIWPPTNICIITSQLLFTVVALYLGFGGQGILVCCLEFTKQSITCLMSIFTPKTVTHRRRKRRRVTRVHQSPNHVFRQLLVLILQFCCLWYWKRHLNKQQALSDIKHKKLTSLQHRVRATKSHIQNSTNHFSGIM